MWAAGFTGSSYLPPDRVSETKIIGYSDKRKHGVTGDVSDLLLLRSSIGVVAYVTVFNSSATWAATYYSVFGGTDAQPAPSPDPTTCPQP